MANSWPPNVVAIRCPKEGRKTVANSWPPNVVATRCPKEGQKTVANSWPPNVVAIRCPKEGRKTVANSWPRNVAARRCQKTVLLAPLLALPRAFVGLFGTDVRPRTGPKWARQPSTNRHRSKKNVGKKIAVKMQVFSVPQ